MSFQRRSLHLFWRPQAIDRRPLVFWSPQAFDRSPLVFFGDPKLLIADLSILLETPSFYRRPQDFPWKPLAFHRIPNIVVGDTKF